MERHAFGENQLPQMVRIAQRVQHAGHRVVRLPVVMHDNAGDLRQQAAPDRHASQSADCASPSSSGLSGCSGAVALQPLVARLPPQLPGPPPGLRTRALRLADRRPVGSILLMLLAVAAYRLQLDSRTVPVAGIVGGVVATALTGWPAADFRPAVTRPLPGGLITIGAGGSGTGVQWRHDRTHKACPLPLYPAGTGVHPAGAGHVLRDPSVSGGRFPAADMAWWSLSRTAKSATAGPDNG